MDQKVVFLTILGMALVTLLPRVLPGWLLAKRDISDDFKDWLGNIPVAVLSAMLLPGILLKDKAVSLEFSNIFLWVTIPTALVSWKTKNFFLTIATGMTLIALARYFGIG